MSFDYFYGPESESYSFCRIPKVLITDPYFKCLSTDAKLLYGLLLDRMSLSARNGWRDDADRVYIYYTLDEIQDGLNCGHGKAVKLLAELDSAKGIGLIERVRQGLGKPDRIYVKQFIPHEGDNRARPPRPKNGKPEVRKPNVQTSENRTSRVPNTEPADFRKADGSNNYNNQTNLNQTYMSYTDPSIYPSPWYAGAGTMERWKVRERLKEWLEYDILMEMYHGDPNIDSMIEVIIDVLRSDAPTERINNANIPIEDVQDRLRRLERGHIEYAIDSIQKTKSEISNMRGYLLTTLYNAQPLADSHVAAQVRHDFG